MSNKELKDTSGKIIDMLVGATLKRHNVQLDSQNLQNEDREQLKKLVEELKQDVQSLKEEKKADES